MKRPLTQLCVLLALAMSLAYTFLWLPAQAEEAKEGTRWDVQAMKDFLKWEGLLQEPYVAATSAKAAWATKKKVLERLLTQYPKSAYGDDVAIALACGIAACERDLQRAEALLTRIIEDYPEGKSLMGPWRPSLSYCLDRHWYIWARDLARVARRGRRNGHGGFQGNLSPSRGAALAYFSHLEKYPNFTRDVAIYYRIRARHPTGQDVDALAELKEFIASGRSRLIELNKADREASTRTDGAFIRAIERPIIWATRDLVSALHSHGKLDEAIAAAESFAGSLSSDGWYWWMNELLGDLYQERAGEEQSTKAEEQYRLALEGYTEWANGITVLGDNRFPAAEAHARPILKLKRKIRRAGGKIELTADGIESWTRGPAPITGPIDAGVKPEARPATGEEGPLAALEQRLKRMPEHEMRQFCLEEAQKLADTPDAAPEKLMFLMKGLRQDDDPPQVRVLRKILRRTKNEEVRTECLRLLSKWITDASEIREDVLAILEGRLKDDRTGVRAAVVRALGESGDPRYVRVLIPALADTDRAVQQQAAEAICTLLGWKPRRPQSDEEFRGWIDDLKAALAPAVKALNEVEEAAQEPTAQ